MKKTLWIALLVISGWQIRSVSADPREQERGELKTREAADAWLQRYDVAAAQKACGSTFQFRIDWKSFDTAENNEPFRVVGEQWCGALPKIITDVCGEEEGRTAMKGFKIVQCEHIVGKATTKPTTKIFEVEDDKHAYDISDGTLTIKLGKYIGSGFFPGRVIETVFPAVRWRREVKDNLPALARHYTSWTEGKDGIDFDVDINPAGFATASYAPFYYLCGGNGNSGHPYPENGKLFTFITELYKNAKGKQLLKKVKHVTCSATTDLKGKVAQISGDRLTVYFRVVKEHFQASVLAATGQRFPQNDGYFAYALFRQKQGLGGECPWNRNAMDKDPEADKLCPEKK